MSRKPDPIDIHVGSRVRARRKHLKLSQTQLGKVLGVTFQQVQKYELGLNRIASNKLFYMSVHLSVPITYFFEGADTKLLVGVAYTLEDLIQTEETQEVLRAYYGISDPRVRRKVVNLVQILASPSQERILRQA